MLMEKVETQNSLIKIDARHKVVILNVHNYDDPEANKDAFLKLIEIIKNESLEKVLIDEEEADQAPEEFKAWINSTFFPSLKASANNSKLKIARVEPSLESFKAYPDFRQLSSNAELQFKNFTYPERAYNWLNT